MEDQIAHNHSCVANVPPPILLELHINIFMIKLWLIDWDAYQYHSWLNCEFVMRCVFERTLACVFVLLTHFLSVNNGFKIWTQLSGIIGWCKMGFFFFFFFKLRKVVDNLCNIIKMVSTWKIKNAIFNYACLYFVIFYYPHKICGNTFQSYLIPYFVF